MIKYELNKTYSAREKLYRMGPEDFYKYVESLEDQAINLIKEMMKANQDWDNPTLAREWNIDSDEIARCRKKGLAYYKKGRDYYYTPEARREYLENAIKK